jgi:excisionase family DNA binding protein
MATNPLRVISTNTDAAPVKLADATPPPIERLCTIADWADALQVSRRLIERMLSARKIPPADLYCGRLPRWKRSTLAAWIEAGGAQ